MKNLSLPRAALSTRGAQRPNSYQERKGIKSPIVAELGGSRGSASIGKWSRFVARLVWGISIASCGWAWAGQVGVVVQPAQFDLVADGSPALLSPGTVTGTVETYEAQPGVLTGRAPSTATALIAAGPPQSGSPLPMPEADVHAATFGTAGIPGSLPAGAASVDINYWFTVLPVGNGTLGTPVPLIVEASGSVGVSNPKYASAHVAFSFNASGVQISKSLTTSKGAPDFIVDTNVSVAAGVVGGVTMGVGVDVFGNVVTQSGSSGEATLDPLIEIDPSFADASDYQLVFSPNLQPTVSGVPDRGATLGLLAVAVSGLLALQRVSARASEPVTGR